MGRLDGWSTRNCSAPYSDRDGPSSCWCHQAPGTGRPDTDPTAWARSPETWVWSAEMDSPLWAERPLPSPLHDQLPPWGWELRQPADLTRSRIELHTSVLGAGVPPGDIAGAVERLLLAYEELASNGLRHGQAPVQAAVTAAGNGWLIDVTDAAVDRPPTPAAGRDPALGGLGLFLITRLCASYGWSIVSGRKHVWGHVTLAG